MRLYKNFYRISMIALVLSVTLMIITETAFSTTYYVSGTIGNDSNTGTSSTTPWKTIQKAANLLNPGDICTVLDGNYNERTVITRSGTSGNPISFAANGTVITKGFSIIASYVEITGFEVTNTVSGHWRDSHGIYVEGTNCKIINNYIHDVALSGIRLLARPTGDSITTSYCTITGNRIVRASLSGIAVEGRNHSIESNDISGTLKNDQTDADGITFFGSGHIFKDNRIHDIYLTDTGNSAAHIDCFQTWGPAYNVIFQQNYCDNRNDGMQGFMIEAKNGSVHDLMVRNNIINAFRIMNIWDCATVSILNNTFTSKLSYTAVSAYGIELHRSPSSRILNNIFIDFGRHIFPYMTADLESKQNLTVGTNCIFMSDGISPAGSPNVNDLWQVDPKLQDMVNGDFHPRADSPLIDAGVTLNEVVNDYYGTSRPQGSGIDIGAIEYKSSISWDEDVNLRVIPN